MMRFSIGCAIYGQVLQGESESIISCVVPVCPLAEMATRIIAPFHLPDLYVWHCHIVSHEDHDMMRPLLIVPPRLIAPVSRTFMVKIKKHQHLQINVNIPFQKNTVTVNNADVNITQVA